MIRINKFIEPLKMRVEYKAYMFKVKLENELSAPLGDGNRVILNKLAGF